MCTLQSSYFPYVQQIQSNVCISNRQKWLVLLSIGQCYPMSPWGWRLTNRWWWMIPHAKPEPITVTLPTVENWLFQSYFWSWTFIFGFGIPILHFIWMKCCFWVFQTDKYPRLRFSHILLHKMFITLRCSQVEISKFTRQPPDSTVPQTARCSRGDHMRESENRGPETGSDEQHLFTETHLFTVRGSVPRWSSK